MVHFPVKRLTVQVALIYHEEQLESVQVEYQKDEMVRMKDWQEDIKKNIIK